MGYIAANLAAILAATLAGLLVGAGYVALAGRGRRSGIGRLGLLLTAAVAEFWLACILAGALILAPARAGAWTMALGSAVVIWIGFVTPVLAVTHRFRRLAATAFLADAGHWLVVMTAQAAVLHMIGLARP